MLTETNAASSLRAARVNRVWSVCETAISRSAASACSPNVPRQLSRIRLAAAGEAWPDICSRASSESAAGSGSWSLRVMRSKPSASHSSFRRARRLAATPSM